jgi:hypothetical protein
MRLTFRGNTALSRLMLTFSVALIGLVRQQY